MTFLTRLALPIFLGLALYFSAFLPAPNDAALAAEGIEEIVVQAPRREANIQDIPIAVTALDQEMLDKRSIRNFNDIQYYVPNLTSAGGLTLRGLGRIATVGDASDPGFAIHVNGVYAARGSLVAGIHDLESLEILRGPQGTLYGRNSIAGTLNLIYKKPVMNFETSGDVEFGNYARQRFRFVVNTPVVKNKVAIRVAGLVENRNGYNEASGTGQSYEEQAPVVGTDYGNVDRLRIRSSMLYELTKDLSAILTWTYDHNRGFGGNSHYLGSIRDATGDDGNGQFEVVKRSDPETFARLRDSSSDLRKGNEDYPSHQRQTQHFVTSTIEWKPSNAPFRIKSISGYQELDFWSKRDRDQSNLDLIRFTSWDTGWAASTELEAASTNQKSPFQWVFGANYWHETTQRNGGVATIGQDFLTALNNEPTPFETLAGQLPGILGDANNAAAVGEFLEANPSLGGNPMSLLTLTSLEEFAALNRLELLTDRLDLQAIRFGQPGAQVGDVYDAPTADVDSQFHSDIWAIFGEGSYEIRRARLIVGLRYGVTDREYLQTNFHPLADLIAGTPCASTCSRDWEAFTWKVAMDYDVPERFLPSLVNKQLLYFIVSTGNRPGGFNFAPDESFDEENLLAYELGAKHALWNNRAELNVGGFFYQLEDAQISQSLEGIPIVNSIPDAEMFGIEIEARAEPVAGLRLNFTFGWQKSEVTSFFCENNAGAPNPETPDAGCTASHPVNLDGNSLPNTPEFNLSFGIEYERRIPRLEGSLTGRFNIVWRDDINYYQFDNPRDVQKAYELIDLRLRYDHDSERFGMEAYVDNVADEEIFANMTFANVTDRIVSLNPPRTFGLRLFARY